MTHDSQIRVAKGTFQYFRREETKLLGAFWSSVQEKRTILSIIKHRVRSTSEVKMGRRSNEPLMPDERRGARYSNMDWKTSWQIVVQKTHH